MSLNEIVPIFLLVCAIVDTLGVRLFLPKMLDQNPAIDKKGKKRLIQLVNIGSILFFIAAVAIFLLKPF